MAGANAAMTPRERLTATLTGRPIDRPPVSLYEIDGFGTRWSPDHPSYTRVRSFVRKNCDNMILETPSIPGPYGFLYSGGDPGLVIVETRRAGDDEITRTTIATPRGPLSMETRISPDIYTVWTTEFLCKNEEDVRRLLSLPFEPLAPDFADFDTLNAEVGDSGIMMPDVNDPIVMVSSVMQFEDYITLATLSRPLFRRLLDFFAERIGYWLDAVTERTTGIIYRIVGPELCTPPYMPPEWFREFIVEYDRPFIDTIRKSGSFARIHCHGNIAKVAHMMLEMEPDALDPLEEPPGGDIAFGDAKRILGGSICLMGNIQESMFELAKPENVVREVRRIKEIGAPDGRFVVMPTATPISVPLTSRQEENLFAYLETALEQ